MWKSSDTRLDETITFVRNNPLLNLMQRTKAADLLDRFVAASPGQAKTLSAAMHIGDNSADPNEYRHNRRAYVFLHGVIAISALSALQGLPPGNISIAGVTAVANLPALVRLAAIMRDQQALVSRMMTEALHDLEVNPLAFLQNNRLIVYGSTVRDATQGDRNELPFYFSFDLLLGRFRFTPDAQAGAAMIMVDSVVARWWTDIPGGHVAGGATGLGDFSQLSGIQLGARMMVTTQFTGCAFAMKRHAGHVYCAHTTPKPPTGFGGAVRAMTGNQLAGEIHSLNGVAGDFANAAGGNPLTIYGAGQSFGTIGNMNYPIGLGGGGSYMTIVGIPVGAGDYHIYSQVTQNHAISSAQRIF